MIIRINETENLSGQFYSAFLVTDAGEVSVAPPNESFLYIAALARRVKELLSVKTPENIRIDYPVGFGTQPMQSGKLDIDAPNLSGAVLEAYEETCRPFKPFFPKPAFSPAGTLAGIKLQVQNVQERITDLDAYREFINAVDDLVSGMAEDHVARLEEKEAKGNAQGSPKKLGAMEVTMIRQWRQNGYRGENYLQYLEGIVDRLAGDELN
jgi:hypothetical protein